MNFKRLSSLICFYAIGLVAIMALFRFLGLRLFQFGDSFGNVMHDVILYTGLLCTTFGALAYSLSRKNRIFSILLFVFLVVIVVFFVVL